MCLLCQQKNKVSVPLFNDKQFELMCHITSSRFQIIMEDELLNGCNVFLIKNGILPYFSELSKAT